jgi:NADH-quinone oxidoreductase subunit K
MFITQISVSLIFFLIGTGGILFNRAHILTVFMCVEIMLLGVSLITIIFSCYLDDMLGQFVSLFILTLAASEVAIGLAILILFFALRSNIRVP